MVDSSVGDFNRVHRFDYNVTAENTDEGNPPSEGVVETNANTSPNPNSKTVSSNKEVRTNNNGNKNTRLCRYRSFGKEKN
jgi:hypothetical protein